MNTKAIVKEVLAASENWIQHFNQGDVGDCVNGYAEQAVMTVHPHGTFSGKTEIAAFWKNFFEEANPRDLEYRNVRVYMQDEHTAVLSATWSMNVGSGFISKERWVKGEDGQWFLEEDDFSITHQHAARAKDTLDDTALIVVDLQNDYFADGMMPLHDTAAAAGKAAALIASFRKGNLPVIHVRHEFTEPNAPFFEQGSVGSEIHGSVAPVAGEAVVVKSKINSFKGTELENLLIGANVRKLVIVGAMVQMCIDSIVRHASDAGYQCTVIHDACAAPEVAWNGTTVPAIQVKATLLSALEFAYARVCSSQEWLSHPQ